MTDNLTAELARLNELDVKRTPGKWHAYRGSKYLEIGSDFDGGRTIICTDYSFIDDQDEMDATLLAAAPDAVALANKLHALLVQAEGALKKIEASTEKAMRSNDDGDRTVGLDIAWAVSGEALTAIHAAGIGGSDGK